MLVFYIQGVVHAAEQKITYDIKPGQDYIYYDVTNGADDDYILKLTVSGSWAEVDLSPSMEWSGSAAEYPTNISDCPDSSDPSYETFSFTGSTDPVSSASMHGDGWFGYVAECGGSGGTAGSPPTWDLDIGDDRDFGVRVPDDNPKYGLVGDRINLQGYSFYTSDDEGVGTTIEGDWKAPPSGTELYDAESGGNLLNTDTNRENLTDVYAVASKTGDFKFEAALHTDSEKTGEETLQFHTLNLNIEGVDDDKEVDPGGYISVGTNNLQRINVVLAESRMERDITLKVNEGAGVVKIWENSDGTQSVISDSQSEKEWLANTTVPTEMYVELLSTTTNSVVNLELSYAGHGGNTNGVDTVKFNLNGAKIKKLVSRQKLEFKKYFLPGGAGATKNNQIITDFLLVGPYHYDSSTGTNTFIFDVELEDVLGDLSSILFGVVNAEYQDYNWKPKIPYKINSVKTSLNVARYANEDKYRVDITDLPEGSGATYFVLGFDEDGNGVLSKNEVSTRDLLLVKFISNQDYEDSYPVVEFAQDAAAVLQYHLASYHLSRFNNRTDPVRAAYYKSQIFSVNLDGDDERLEHRVGANWGETGAFIPHVFYPELSPVNEKIRTNTVFVTILKDLIKNKCVEIKQNINSANGEVQDGVSLTNVEVELADISDNPRNNSDVYNAFGKARLTGTLTFTANLVNSELIISNADFKGFLTDLYDWDYTFAASSGNPLADFVTVDDICAKVQAGYPQLGDRGGIYSITAVVNGEVDITVIDE